MIHYHVVISIPRTSPLYDEAYRQLMEGYATPDKHCVQLPRLLNVPIDSYLFCPEGICLYTMAAGTTYFGEGKLVFGNTSDAGCGNELFSMWYEQDSELGGGDE